MKNLLFSFCVIFSLSSFSLSNSAFPLQKISPATQVIKPDIPEKKKGILTSKSPAGVGTIDSDDGNTYTTNSAARFVVNDYVYHSDPVNGEVIILGLVE